MAESVSTGYLVQLTINNNQQVGELATSLKQISDAVKELRSGKGDIELNFKVGGDKLPGGAAGAAATPKGVTAELRKLREEMASGFGKLQRQQGATVDGTVPVAQAAARQAARKTVKLAAEDKIFRSVMKDELSGSVRNMGQQYQTLQRRLEKAIKGGAATVGDLTKAVDALYPASGPTSITKQRARILKQMQKATDAELNDLAARLKQEADQRVAGLRVMSSTMRSGSRADVRKLSRDLMTRVRVRSGDDPLVREQMQAIRRGDGSEATQRKMIRELIRQNRRTPLIDESDLAYIASSYGGRPTRRGRGATVAAAPEPVVGRVAAGSVTVSPKVTLDLTKELGQLSEVVSLLKEAVNPLKTVASLDWTRVGTSIIALADLLGSVRRRPRRGQEVGTADEGAGGGGGLSAAVPMASAESDVPGVRTSRRRDPNNARIKSQATVAGYRKRAQEIAEENLGKLTKREQRAAERAAARQSRASLAFEALLTPDLMEFSDPEMRKLLNEQQRKREERRIHGGSILGVADVANWEEGFQGPNVRELSKNEMQLLRQGLATIPVPGNAARFREELVRRYRALALQRQSRVIGRASEANVHGERPETPIEAIQREFYASSGDPTKTARGLAFDAAFPPMRGAIPTEDRSGRMLPFVQRLLARRGEIISRYGSGSFQVTERVSRALQNTIGDKIAAGTQIPWASSESTVGPTYGDLLAKLVKVGTDQGLTFESGEDGARGFTGPIVEAKRFNQALAALRRKSVALPPEAAEEVAGIEASLEGMAQRGVLYPKLSATDTPRTVEGRRLRILMKRIVERNLSELNRKKFASVYSILDEPDIRGRFTPDDVTTALEELYRRRVYETPAGGTQKNTRAEGPALDQIQETAERLLRGRGRPETRFIRRGLGKLATTMSEDVIARAFAKELKMEAELSDVTGSGMSSGDWLARLNDPKERKRYRNALRATMVRVGDDDKQISLDRLQERVAANLMDTMVAYVASGARGGDAAKFMADKIYKTIGGGKPLNFDLVDILGASYKRQMTKALTERSPGALRSTVPGSPFGLTLDDALRQFVLYRQMADQVDPETGQALTAYGPNVDDLYSQIEAKESRKKRRRRVKQQQERLAEQSLDLPGERSGGIRSMIQRDEMRLSILEQLRTGATGEVTSEAVMGLRQDLAVRDLIGQLFAPLTEAEKERKEIGRRKVPVGPQSWAARDLLLGEIRDRLAPPVTDLPLLKRFKQDPLTTPEGTLVPGAVRIATPPYSLPPVPIRDWEQMRLYEEGRPEVANLVGKPGVRGAASTAFGQLLAGGSLQDVQEGLRAAIGPNASGEELAAVMARFEKLLPVVEQYRATLRKLRTSPTFTAGFGVQDPKLAEELQGRSTVPYEVLQQLRAGIGFADVSLSGPQASTEQTLRGGRRLADRKLQDLKDRYAVAAVAREKLQKSINQIDDQVRERGKTYRPDDTELLRLQELYKEATNQRAPALRVPENVQALATELGDKQRLLKSVNAQFTQFLLALKNLAESSDAEIQGLPEALRARATKMREQAKKMMAIDPESSTSTILRALQKTDTPQGLDYSKLFRVPGQQRKFLEDIQVDDPEITRMLEGGVTEEALTSLGFFDKGASPTKLFATMKKRLAEAMKSYRSTGMSFARAANSSIFKEGAEIAEPSTADYRDAFAAAFRTEPLLQDLFAPGVLKDRDIAAKEMGRLQDVFATLTRGQAEIIGMKELRGGQRISTHTPQNFYDYVDLLERVREYTKQIPANPTKSGSVPYDVQMVKLDSPLDLAQRQVRRLDAILAGKDVPQIPSLAVPRKPGETAEEYERNLRKQLEYLKTRRIPELTLDDAMYERKNVTEGFGFLFDKVLQQYSTGDITGDQDPKIKRIRKLGFPDRPDRNIGKDPLEAARLLLEYGQGEDMSRFHGALERARDNLGLAQETEIEVERRAKKAKAAKAAASTADVAAAVSSVTEPGVAAPGTPAAVPVVPGAPAAPHVPGRPAIPGGIPLAAQGGGPLPVYIVRHESQALNEMRETIQSALRALGIKPLPGETPGFPAGKGKEKDAGTPKRMTLKDYEALASDARAALPDETKKRFEEEITARSAKALEEEQAAITLANAKAAYRSRGGAAGGLIGAYGPIGPALYAGRSAAGTPNPPPTELDILSAAGLNLDPVVAARISRDRVGEIGRTAKSVLSAQRAVARRGEGLRGMAGRLPLDENGNPVATREYTAKLRQYRAGANRIADELVPDFLETFDSFTDQMQQGRDDLAKGMMSTNAHFMKGIDRLFGRGFGQTMLSSGLQIKGQLEQSQNAWRTLGPARGLYEEYRGYGDQVSQRQSRVAELEALRNAFTTPEQQQSGEYRRVSAQLGVERREERLALAAQKKTAAAFALQVAPLVNSGALGMDESKIDKFQQAINRLGQSYMTSARAAATWASGVVQAAQKAANTEPFFDRAARAVRNVFLYSTAGMFMYNFFNSLQQGVQLATEYERVLSRIQGIMSSRSREEVERLSAGVLATSREYGVSPLETLGQAQVFTQAGFTAEEAALATREAVRAQLGAGLSAEQAQELLIAIRNISGGTIGFENIIDRISRVEGSRAVSAQDLALSLQRVGSLANQLFSAGGGARGTALNPVSGRLEENQLLTPRTLGGIDFADLVVGLTTAVVEKTRVSGNQAATGIRFILSRLSAPEISGNLQRRYGIDLAATPDGKTLRPLIDILRDISNLYQQLRSTGQTGRAAQLLQTVAGARQINLATAIFEDFDSVMDIATESASAFGDTTDRVNLVMETLAQQVDRLQSSFQAWGVNLLEKTGLGDLLGITAKTAADAGGIAREFPGLGILGMSATAGGVGWLAGKLQNKYSMTTVGVPATIPTGAPAGFMGNTVGSAAAAAGASGWGARMMGGRTGQAALGKLAVGASTAMAGMTTAGLALLAMQIGKWTVDQLSNYREQRGFSGAFGGRDVLSSAELRGTEFYRLFQRRAETLGMGVPGAAATVRRVAEDVNRESAGKSFVELQKDFVDRLSNAIPPLGAIADESVRTEQALKLLNDALVYYSAKATSQAQKMGSRISDDIQRSLAQGEERSLVNPNEGFWGSLIQGDMSAVGRVLKRWILPDAQGLKYSPEMDFSEEPFFKGVYPQTSNLVEHQLNRIMPGLGNALKSYQIDQQSALEGLTTLWKEKKLTLGQALDAFFKQLELTPRQTEQVEYRRMQLQRMNPRAVIENPVQYEQRIQGLLVRDLAGTDEGKILERQGALVTAFEDAFRERYGLVGRKAAITGEITSSAQGGAYALEKLAEAAEKAGRNLQEELKLPEQARDLANLQQTLRGAARDSYALATSEGISSIRERLVDVIAMAGVEMQTALQMSQHTRDLAMPRTYDEDILAIVRSQVRNLEGLRFRLAAEQLQVGTRLYAQPTALAMDVINGMESTERFGDVTNALIRGGLSADDEKKLAYGFQTLQRQLEILTSDQDLFARLPAGLQELFKGLVLLTPTITDTKEQMGLVAITAPVLIEAWKAAAAAAIDNIKRVQDYDILRRSESDYDVLRASFSADVSRRTQPAAERAAELRFGPAARTNARLAAIPEELEWARIRARAQRNAAIVTGYGETPQAVNQRVKVAYADEQKALATAEAQALLDQQYALYDYYSEQWLDSLQRMGQAMSDASRGILGILSSFDEFNAAVGDSGDSLGTRVGKFLGALGKPAADAMRQQNSQILDRALFGESGMLRGLMTKIYGAPEAGRREALETAKLNAEVEMRKASMNPLIESQSSLRVSIESLRDAILAQERATATQAEAKITEFNELSKRASETTEPEKIPLRPAPTEFPEKSPVRKWEDLFTPGGGVRAPNISEPTIKIPAAVSDPAGGWGAATPATPLTERALWGGAGGLFVPEFAINAALGALESTGDPETLLNKLWPSLIQQESGGKQSARSKKGAIGLAQLLPGTGPEAAELAGLPWSLKQLETDPEYNQALGQAYLKKQLKRFGDAAKALAAYNAGPSRVHQAVRAHGDSWLSKLPKETQNYVQSIMQGSGLAGSAKGVGGVPIRSGLFAPQFALSAAAAAAEEYKSSPAAVARTMWRNRIWLQKHTTPAYAAIPVSDSQLIPQANLPNWYLNGLMSPASSAQGGVVPSVTRVATKSTGQPFGSGRLRNSRMGSIILHSTEGSLGGTLSELEKTNNSYHYVIDKDGAVVQLVDPAYQADHVGYSAMPGIGAGAIGISLVGHANKGSYTDEQYSSLSRLTRDLQEKYPEITNNRIAYHSDVAFGYTSRGQIGTRRTDPGKNFDAERFVRQLADSKHGIGFGFAPVGGRAGRPGAEPALAFFSRGGAESTLAAARLPDIETTGALGIAAVASDGTRLRGMGINPTRVQTRTPQRRSTFEILAEWRRASLARGGAAHANNLAYQEWAARRGTSPGDEAQAFSGPSTTVALLSKWGSIAREGFAVPSVPTRAGGSLLSASVTPASGIGPQRRAGADTQGAAAPSVPVPVPTWWSLLSGAANVPSGGPNIPGYWNKFLTDYGFQQPQNLLYTRPIPDNKLPTRWVGSLENQLLPGESPKDWKDYGFGPAPDFSTYDRIRQATDPVLKQTSEEKIAQKELELQQQAAKDQKVSMQQILNSFGLIMGAQIGGMVGNGTPVSQTFSSFGSMLGQAAGTQFLGSALGTFGGPVGAIAGGVLGGLLGGLFGGNEPDIPVSPLERIERNTAETVQAIENQTGQLLSLESRLLNVPATFSVPSYRPMSYGSGTSAPAGSSTTVNANMSFVIQDARDPNAVAKAVTVALKDEMRRFGLYDSAR